MTRVPSAFLAGLALLLAGGALGVACSPRTGSVPPSRATLDRTLDSLRQAVALSEERLKDYAREVTRLRGDSLRQAVLQRAKARRPTLPPALLPPAPESTATPEEQREGAERVLLVSDSACRVSLDSCRASCAGIEAQARYDLEESAHALHEARRARWTWAGWGAVAGAVGAGLLVLLTGR